MYILVSQCIEIYRTNDKAEAEKIMEENNKLWHKYCTECIMDNKSPADNEVFMYTE